MISLRADYLHQIRSHPVNGTADETSLQPGWNHFSVSEIIRFGHFNCEFVIFYPVIVAALNRSLGNGNAGS